MARVTSLTRCDVAEVAPRGGRGLGRTRSRFDTQLCFALEVKPDLVVEVAVVLVATPDTQLETLPPVHDSLQAGSRFRVMTRAMVSTTLFHRDCSAASCFLPAGVNR